jgi:hypothetical protein
MKRTLHIVRFGKHPISFESIVEITQYRLRAIWDSYFSDKPYPNVRAFILKDDEFLMVDKRLEICPSTISTEIKEYGHRIQREKDVGLIFPAPNGVKIILIKEHSTKYTLDEILEHELRHTYNGDAELIKGDPK